MDNNNYYLVYKKDCVWCIQLMKFISKIPELESLFECIDSDIYDVKNISNVPTIIDTNGNIFQDNAAFQWIIEKCKRLISYNTDHEIINKYNLIINQISTLINNTHTTPKQKISPIKSPVSTSNIEFHTFNNNKLVPLSRNNNNIKLKDIKRKINPISISDTQLHSYLDNIVREREKAVPNPSPVSGLPKHKR